MMLPFKNLMKGKLFNPAKDKYTTLREKNMNQILHLLGGHEGRQPAVYETTGWQMSLRGDRINKWALKFKIWIEVKNG